ncbi:50S ribosomal protein L21e [Candidatus Woesearchaeota archaeon]|nr:50S ribosomal protein L21e [Candidatus Woesearchaeota archaeon]
MNRIRGMRGKSRYKLRKGIKERGKISISRFMQEFESGQKVHLIWEPSYHKGIYHTRFHGKTGTIKAARGKCYEVIINDEGKEKMILVHPVHLKAEG